MPEWMKAPVLALLRVPPEPHAPAGAPGTLLVFRAASGFFYYRLVAWALKQAMTLMGVAFGLFLIWQESEASAPFIGRLFLGIELAAVAFVLLGVPFSFLMLRLDYKLSKREGCSLLGLFGLCAAAIVWLPG